MKSLALILLNLLAPAHALEKATCSEVSHRLTYLFNGKTIEWSNPYCYDLEDFKVLSENCFPKLECEAVRAYRKAPAVSMTGAASANPFHRRCQAIGGEALMASLHKKEKIEESAICFFKKDRSFISVWADVSTAR